MEPTNDGPWVCANCDDYNAAERHTCSSCDWRRDAPVDRTKPLCAVCRRRHGPEVEHASE
jgi:hypothetical protein